MESAVAFGEKSMKIWRKRITSVSGRDNAGSAVFAHTLLAMSLLAGYVVLGMGTAGLLAYTGLHTDPARSPYHRLLVPVCRLVVSVGCRRRTSYGVLSTVYASSACSSSISSVKPTAA